ncbi:MAG: VOC family protein [Erysipelotrichaceae bacterium]
MESMVVFYPCTNIEETYTFYTKIIGLTLYEDQGMCKILDSGYGYIGFCQYDDPTLATKTCISFNLNNKEEVDLMHQKMQSCNVEITSPPSQHPKFNVYSFFMKDPNGYTVEFQKITK